MDPEPSFLAASAQFERYLSRRARGAASGERELACCRRGSGSWRLREFNKVAYRAQPPAPAPAAREAEVVHRRASFAPNLTDSSLASRIAHRRQEAARMRAGDQWHRTDGRSSAGPHSGTSEASPEPPAPRLATAAAWLQATVGSFWSGARGPDATGGTSHTGEGGGGDAEGDAEAEAEEDSWESEASDDEDGDEEAPDGAMIGAPRRRLSCPPAYDPPGYVEDLPGIDDRRAIERHPVRRVFARHRSIELGSAFGTPKAEAGRLSSRVSTWRTREAEKLAMSLHSHFNFDVCLVVDVSCALGPDGRSVRSTAWGIWDGVAPAGGATHSLAGAEEVATLAALAHALRRCEAGARVLLVSRSDAALRALDEGWRACAGELAKLRSREHGLMLEAVVRQRARVIGDYAKGIVVLLFSPARGGAVASSAYAAAIANGHLLESPRARRAEAPVMRARRRSAAVVRPWWFELGAKGSINHDFFGIYASGDGAEPLLQIDGPRSRSAPAARPAAVTPVKGAGPSDGPQSSADFSAFSIARSRMHEEKQLRRRSLRMPWFDEDLRNSAQKAAAPRVMRRRSAVFTVPMPPPGAAGPARTPENAAGAMLALQ